MSSSSPVANLASFSSGRNSADERSGVGAAPDANIQADIGAKHWRQAHVRFVCNHTLLQGAAG